MKIIYSKILPFPGFIALNLFGILIVREEFKNKLTKRVLNHEAIHTEQIKETLYVGFYILYLIFWILRLLQVWNFREAYRSISFEQEAYSSESNLDYLKTRQPYAWISYQFSGFRESQKKPLI